jgi:uncharacterized protein (DUF433 family)
MTDRMTAPPADSYGGADPRELPVYGVAEAAHYLWLPENTVRSWVAGRTFPGKHGPQRSPGVVKAADSRRQMLSFVNLLELHVLSAIRREHGIDMRKVRVAVRLLADKFGSAHPLIDQEMLTDGTDLFLDRIGHLINLSQDGQLAMRGMLEAHLQRIDRDADGLAVRLYPFTRPAASSDAPRLIVIDPRRAFGRPVIANTRIPTTDVFERFKAGDSLDDLVAEYGRSTQEIQEAIRYEAERAA